MTRKELFEKIKNDIEQKMLNEGIMGTESCNISINITEEEREIFVESVDDEFDEHYYYDIEEGKNNNTLYVSYTEEIECEITKDDVLKNLKNLIGIEYGDSEELEDDIICAFGDFKENGSDEVFISESFDVDDDGMTDSQCYINAEDSTIFGITTQYIYNKEGVKIAEKLVDAWIY